MDILLKFDEDIFESAWIYEGQQKTNRLSANMLGGNETIREIYSTSWLMMISHHSTDPTLSQTLLKGQSHAEVNYMINDDKPSQHRPYALSNIIKGTVSRGGELHD